MGGSEADIQRAQQRDDRVFMRGVDGDACAVRGQARDAVQRARVEV